MTVETSYDPLAYPGNDVTTFFAVDWEFIEETTLVVQLVMTDGTTVVDQVLNSDYTVQGGNGSTGSVTMVTAPATGEQLIISRFNPRTQLLDLETNQDLPAESLEQAYDRLTLIDQEITSDEARNLKLAITTTVPDAIFPDPSAGLAVFGNEVGDGWVNLPITDFGQVPIPLSVIQGGTGATGAANARVNLGLATVSQAEAEAGSSTTTRAWTSERVKQAAVSAGGGITGQCVLEYVSATEIKLSPESGNGLVIDGEAQAVPDAGVTLDNTGLGTTFHYVYAFMSASVMELELSTDVPVKGVGGIWQKTGDATRSLVGAVAGNASSQYEDSATARLVRSWFNDPLSAAQVTNAAEVAVTSTTFAVIAGMAVDFVAFAAETWAFDMGGTLRVDSTNNVLSCAMGLGGTAINGGGAAASAATIVIGNAAGHHAQKPGAGKHTLDIRCKITGGAGSYGSNAGDVTSRGILTATPHR